MAPLPSSSSGSSSSLLFDIESYISRYDVTSETRLERLLFIVQRCEEQQQAEHASSPPLQEISHMALDMARRQMMETGNVKRYREVFGDSSNANPSSSSNNNNNNNNNEAGSNGVASVVASASVVGGSGAADPSWMVSAELAFQKQTELLEARLSSAQAHLSKDAIRTAYLALGENYARRGELREALKCVTRSRDYCTSNRQLAHVFWQTIELGISTRNFPLVHEYVNKAEHIISSSTAAAGINTASSLDPLYSSKVKLASGLTLLHESKYEDAAQQFTSIPFSTSSNSGGSSTSGSEEDIIGGGTTGGSGTGTAVTSSSMMMMNNNLYSNLMALEDVTLYGALLALATFSRAELQFLQTNSSFKNWLELVPPLRDALAHFGRAEYRACLQRIDYYLNITNHHQQQQQQQQQQHSTTTTSTTTNTMSILTFDLHLSKHADTILGMIRDRCLIQYIVPYSHVKIACVAEVFQMSIDQMEERLVGLIGSGALGDAARIDGCQQLLITNPQQHQHHQHQKNHSPAAQDQQQHQQQHSQLIMQRETQKRVLQMGQTFRRNTESMLLRLMCLEHDLVVGKGTTGSSNRGGGGNNNKASWGARGGRASAAMMTYSDSDDDDDDDDDVNVDVDVDVDDGNNNNFRRDVVVGDRGGGGNAAAPQMYETSEMMMMNPEDIY